MIVHFCLSYCYIRDFTPIDKLCLLINIMFIIIFVLTYVYFSIFLSVYDNVMLTIIKKMEEYED